MGRKGWRAAAHQARGPFSMAAAGARPPTLGSTSRPGSPPPRGAPPPGSASGPEPRTAADRWLMARAESWDGCGQIPTPPIPGAGPNAGRAVAPADQWQSASPVLPARATHCNRAKPVAAAGIHQSAPPATRRNLPGEKAQPAPGPAHRPAGDPPLPELAFVSSHRYLMYQYPFRA